MAHSKKNEFTEKEMRLAVYARALSILARFPFFRFWRRRTAASAARSWRCCLSPQSTVSQHLKELKKAGLNTGEIEGPRSCYCINKTH
jgi:DNA-binding transcriptional ArsR family regulator